MTALRLLSALLAAALIAGCGGGGGGGATEGQGVSTVLPTASFARTPATGISTVTVRFTDTSDAGSSAITAWLWDFGDGSTSREQSPTHTYTTSGPYDVSLRVTTSAGSNTKSSPASVVVTAPVLPTASFSRTPTTGISTVTVQFTDTSVAGSAAITAWLWDFGDGATSREQNPTHTFTTLGTNEVSLQVTTLAGSNTKSIPASVIVTAPATSAPTASFSRTPTTGLSTVTVQFTDASAPGSAPITAWRWDFGDGGTSSEQNPTHTFAMVGSWEVSLTVTTSAGSNTKSATGSVVVTAPPTAKPTASFARTPNAGELSVANELKVQFTDTSSAGSDPITAWLWDFGDGGASREQSPTHVYTSYGDFTVSLRVTTLAGIDTKESIKSVVVTEFQPPFIHEGVPGAFLNLYPQLPVPNVLNSELALNSERKLVSAKVLPEFAPIVTSMFMHEWERKHDEGDCKDNFGTLRFPETADSVKGWYNAIPKLQNHEVGSNYWQSAFRDVGDIPTLPGRILLIGKYINPNNSGDVNNYKSFDLSTILGGYGRWQSCNEYIVGFYDDTEYRISYAMPIAVRPIMRKYTKWVRGQGAELGPKIFNAGEPQKTIKYKWSTGVSETKFEEFTKSLTATVGGTAGGFSAELTAALSQTTSVSNTVNKSFDKEEDIIIDPTTHPNYDLLYVFWYAVDVYRIEGNVEGKEWSDPNYKLAPGQFEIEVPNGLSIYQKAWFLKK